MQKSESIKELASALTKAQGEMPAVKFNATNPFLKNKYADLGAIIAASKPILAKHGLAVSQLSTSDDNRIGVETVLMHQSGEFIASSLSMEIADEKGKSSAQVAGSIITYLRRYALASILGMYADEDGDGNAPEQANPKQAPKQAPQRPSAKPEAPLTPAELSAAVQDTRPTRDQILAELPSLTVEEACKAKTSAGVLYCNMQPNVLEKVISNLWKSLLNNGLDPEQHADQVLKLASAYEVLKAKQDGSLS